MTHKLQNVEVSRDDARWEAEIKAEIPADLLLKHRAEALKEIQKTAKLDGFRVGHAPEDRIVAVYGESTIMRHAAEHAIQHELPELLAKEEIAIVETPKVTTDAPESGKPLIFTARAALAPSIELPDYKAIARKHTQNPEDTTVSDEEHAEALRHLRRERARIDKIEAGAEAQKALEESRTLEEKDLPALDDAFVRSLGYESAAKFTEAVRVNIKTEKELRALEKVRAAILDDLAKDAKISYPHALLEYELDDMEARLKDDLSRMGQTFDAFLTAQKRTRDEMRASWKDAADKRAKVRLILAEIAREEKIDVEAKTLDEQAQHAKKHYPEADPEALRAHIAHMMRNDAVLKFLESQK